MSETINDTKLEPFEKRAKRVLACTFRGMHHIGNEITRKSIGTDYEYWAVSTYQDLSTWDYDLLTRLVISAHEECVRVSVGSSGPRMVKIEMWPRKREGGITERHPTIEEATESVRKSLAGWKEDEPRGGNFAKNK